MLGGGVLVRGRLRRSVSGSGVTIEALPSRRPIDQRRVRQFTFFSVRYTMRDVGITGNNVSAPLTW